MHSRLSSSPFVGRSRELTSITQQLAVASRGDGSVVLLSGEPGIGKSRVLVEVAAQAEASGWRVFIGHA